MWERLHRHAWPGATTHSPGHSRPSSPAVCASAARSASCARKQTRCSCGRARRCRPRACASQRSLARGAAGTPARAATRRRGGSHTLGGRAIQRRLVRLPPSRLVAAGRRGRRCAAWPRASRRRAHRGRVLRHVRGRTAQRRPSRRRGARGALPHSRSVLTYVRYAIYTGGWLTGAGKARSTVRPRGRPTGRAQRNRKPAPRSCGGAVQARHHPRQRRRAGPARRL